MWRPAHHPEDLQPHPELWRQRFVPEDVRRRPDRPRPGRNHGIRQQPAWPQICKPGDEPLLVLQVGPVLSLKTCPLCVCLLWGTSCDEEQSHDHLHPEERRRGHAENQRDRTQDQVLHGVLRRAGEQVSWRGVNPSPFHMLSSVSIGYHGGVGVASLASLPLMQRRVRTGGGARDDHSRPAGRLPGAREERPDSPLHLAPPPQRLLFVMSHPVVFVDESEPPWCQNVTQQRAWWVMRRLKW